MERAVASPGLSVPGSRARAVGPACVCWPEGSDGPGSAHAVHAGELPAIDATRSLVRRWVAAVEVDEEIAECIVLAVDEAVTNAVEHGARGRPCHVELTAGPRACGGGVAVCVADDGLWRPPGDPGFRGRGLQLMHELADRCTVDARSDGTTVRMCWGTGTG